MGESFDDLSFDGNKIMLVADEESDQVPPELPAETPARVQQIRSIGEPSSSTSDPLDNVQRTTGALV